MSYIVGSGFWSFVTSEDMRNHSEYNALCLAVERGHPFVLTWPQARTFSDIETFFSELPSILRRSGRLDLAAHVDAFVSKVSMELMIEGLEDLGFR